MKKILIIEDIEDNRDLLIQLLEDDYELLEAEEAITGISISQRQQPDLILMDISLPRMDGLQATQILKNNALTKHIPIIAVTGNAMVGDREKALSAGCDEYVTKPIDISTIFDVIERFI
ncbi:response regulator [Candidatus Uabimicrobium amorphum]|uniref:Response regulator n=1 Tax=Uabimicrobium amorphum TaxID=2596890 RepID=A0A5S9F761_UABAM|nr:response regulator [Candidatus Uabimicrobium amorphum]BBM86922.1 response regulator [Candidatus Uabimicrobium amorphum]